MSETITISSFAKEIQDVLNEYGDDAQRIVDEQVEAVSKDAVKKLKKESPKDTGDYRKGWKMRKKETRFGLETTVYNSTHGYLVHLLEHGHAKRNGGRVAAQPHVGPVQEWSEKELIERIKKQL